ncbi:MAG TPA: metal-dependent transcriptional regulator, partial [Armatimonadota bacterium]|nr:metal-dependent transcriptional regulator [Armatimonadota bacterium]
DLARSLGLSGASVTVMLKRLAEQGYIDYKPYKGITLTDAGREIGAKIIRRHGLLERLLCDVVGVPWHRVDEAVRHLEHFITDEVEERLAHHLGYPTTCPHGQPLDWENASKSRRLSTVKVGETSVISRIGDESPDFLEYMMSLGMLPGAAIEVVSQAPFNGPVMVRVGSREHALGPSVLESVWVETGAAQS